MEAELGVLVASVALVGALGGLAWRFGRDSRDALERDEPARTAAWVAEAARRRERIGAVLANVFMLEMEAKYREERLQRDLERARLVREAQRAPHEQAHAHQVALRDAYESCAGVLLRTLVPGPTVMLSEMVYRRRAETPVHTHASDQVGYVVKGRLRLRLGEQDRLVSTGDTYVVPAEVAHRLQALDDATVLVSSVVA